MKGHTGAIMELQYSTDSRLVPGGVGAGEAEVWWLVPMVIGAGWG